MQWLPAAGICSNQHQQQEVKEEATPTKTSPAEYVPSCASIPSSIASTTTSKKIWNVPGSWPWFVTIAGMWSMHLVVVMETGE